MSKRRSAALLCVVFLALAACATSTGNVYEDAQERSLFEIPEGWNIYEGDELAQVSQVPFSTPAEALPVIDTVAFDGGPGHSVHNLSASIATSPFPVGSQVIRSVSSTGRDALSRLLLENIVMHPDTLESSQEVVDEDFTFGNDYEGIRRFRSFVDATTSETGVAYFISVTDPEDTMIYTMAAGCSAACFEQHRDEIREVVDSWLVNINQ